MSFSRFSFLLLFGLLSCTLRGVAQISFKDTIAEYNKHRLLIDVKGLNAVSAVSLAGIASGGIGYFTAKTDEWRYFHQANVVGGVIDGGIAAFGLLSCRRQLQAPPDMRTAYQRYRNDRTLMLVGIGYNLACMGTGAYLVSHAGDAGANKDMYLGYGRALVVQGAVLAIVDNLMLLAHNKYSGPWATILYELRVTGSGFSFVHTF